MMARELLYFAYGSNMLTERLRGRVPSAHSGRVGHVEGYRLRWHKVGRLDGSGKCDIELTTDSGDRVYGVVFRIARVDKPGLDAAEGLDRGYEEKTVEVITAAGPVSAFTYRATAIDQGLRPFSWYKGYVVAGAIEHRLPVAYVRHLQRVAAIEDPDRERAAEHAHLCDGRYAGRRRGRPA
jgi:gamma-glutamylcyclotransferase